MAEALKMFQHKGARTPATDEIAQKLAEHALRDDHPDVTNVSFLWTHHNQPDLWLLFCTGVISAKGITHD